VVAGRGLQPGHTHRQYIGLDDKVFTLLDSFEINPTYNTDGIGNCLQQTGQLSNQLHKSIHSKFYPLIKFVYRD